MTRVDRDLCLTMHADCAVDPVSFANRDVAELVYRTHAGHGPKCLQGLAAGAYLSEVVDD